jgi:hypothetical protein
MVDKVALTKSMDDLKITRETEIPAPSPGYLVPLVQRFNTASMAFSVFTSSTLIEPQAESMFREVKNPTISQAAQNS